MTRYRRNFVPGASYFFTVNLHNRGSRLLTDHIEPLRAAFRTVRARHPFEIDAIVVLPDHLHAIWTLPPGDDNYPARWRLIKTAFSRSIAPVNCSHPVDNAKVSAVSGSDAIGSTRFATSVISNSIAITSISIRSNTGMP